MNTIKLSFRSLWKNRLFTVLNIIGLSIGISASWVIFRICTYEYSYNKSFSDREKIFKVKSEFDFNGQSGNNDGVPKPLYTLAKKEITGLSHVIPTFDYHVESIKIPLKNKKHKVTGNNTFTTTSPDFFNVFEFPIVAGNAKCLQDKDQIVISDQFAEKYFGNTPMNDIIGQLIVLNDTAQYQIGGIFANTEKPTDITYEAYLPIDEARIVEQEWLSVNSVDQMYLKFDSPDQSDGILKSINTLANARSEQYFKNWGEDIKRWFELTSLDEVHFMTQLGSNVRKANKNVLFVLIGVAFFLLLLAGINYVNMSVANLPNKSKEIGLKKTLGVSSAKIFVDFNIETTIVMVISTLLSFILTELFYKSYPFLIPDGMNAYADLPLFAGFFICFVVGVTWITSLLPAWMMNKMQATDIIRNQFSIAKRGSLLNINKSMVIFQFFVASFFIISSLIINRQIRHLMTMDIGFDKNAVVTIQLPWEIFGDSIKNQKKFALKQEFENQKNIVAVSLSEPLLRDGVSSNIFKRIDQSKPAEVSIQRKPSDPDLLKVYDLKILAGRFVQAGDNGRKFVITAEAAKQFGYATPQDAIGGVIKESYNDENAEIVGVVNDFNTLGVTSPVNPVAIFHVPEQLSGYSIKLDSKRPELWQNTIQSIETTWKRFFPDLTFEYRFYDDTIEKMIEKERYMSSISNLATMITILLSCLGLFGLSLLMSYQRMKEIGIRKVFGASILSIVVAMSRNFLILVTIAVALSIPLVHFISNKFLDQYTYRIELSPWYYISGLVVMLLVAFLTMLYNSLKAARMNPTEVIK
jgi:ABC-type antimicrobial peptide transport system permease subunit